MNGSSQTWIDIMNKDLPPPPKKVSRNGGVTVTPNTPRTESRQYSRINLGGPQGQVEILRSQVVSLLKEKQELTKKVQWEKSQREQIERDMKSKRVNKSVSFHDDASSLSSSSQLQISALREALEQTTQERNTLRNLLTKEKDCSTLLNTQLIEEKTKYDHEKEISREKDEQLEGMRTQIKQMRQELTTMNHLVKKKKDESESSEHLIEQLSHVQGLLSQSERERDALRERLATVETQRQLSMEQYQEEVETSVLAVTTQLEELLELNRQLQEELTHSQNEKEELTSTLNEIQRDNQMLKKEKDQQLIQFEQKISELKASLQQNKQSFQQKINSKDAQHDFNQLELTQEVQETKRELEKQAHIAETRQNDLSHQITLLKHENKSLLEQRESANSLNDKIKLETKRLESEVRTLHNNLRICQREKATLEAQIVTVKAELSTSHDYCTQLKQEVDQLKDVSQYQSQADSLSKELTQTIQQLKDSDTDRKLLQANVKRLESELTEMTHQHHKEIKSKQDQLDTTQALNQQLQIMVADLEKEITFQKKQCHEYTEQIDQMSNNIKLKQAKIQEQEKTIETLSTALTDGNKCQDENHSLHSQISNLKKSIMSLQLERDNLKEKLTNTIQQNKVTEEDLKQENAKLHELLDNSLSLNEKLQSSSNGSSSFQSPLPHKLSPISNFQTPPTSTTQNPPSLSPPPPPSLTQFSSPTSQIIHLKQELEKARETCLKFERQQAQDKTEMSKVQGSLEALVKIQEHLSNENKSLSQTFNNLEEEKEIYKKETERLNVELSSCHDQLNAINFEVSKIIINVLAQLEELSNQLENHSNNVHLSNIRQIIEDGRKEESLEVIPKVIESMSSLLFDCLLEGSDGGLNNVKEIAALQERVTNACQQLKVMEDELETKDKELETKDKELETKEQQLIALQGGTRQDNIESFKKDLETQYQAKLAVVRSKLMEKEDEVNQLQVSEQELKSQLDDAEVMIMSNREELETAKEELSRLRDVVAHCEACLTSETCLIESEIKNQEHAITAIKSELAHIKSQQTTLSLDDKRSQMRCNDDRIYELQSQVEMLRAKKSIFDKYVTTQEMNEEIQHNNNNKDEIILQENLQLVEENDELKQELISLNDMTQHMQDQIDILVLRLEEAQEGIEEDKELEKKELVEAHEKEMSSLRYELEIAKNGFQQSHSLLESKMERERAQFDEIETERDGLRRQVESMKNEMEQIHGRYQNELVVLNERLQNRDAVCADVQSSLEHAIADREEMEIRLNESCPSNASSRNSKKVDKLKDKLKQQIRQTNHIRMKLGYALSELRLYKQLKNQLENQVDQLQNALVLSKRQYDQCFDKLNRLDVYYSTYNHET